MSPAALNNLSTHVLVAIGVRNLQKEFQSQGNILIKSLNQSEIFELRL
jgi:hypothetical protein